MVSRFKGEERMKTYNLNKMKSTYNLQNIKLCRCVASRESNSYNDKGEAYSKGKIHPRVWTLTSITETIKSKLEIRNSRCLGL